MIWRWGTHPANWWTAILCEKTVVLLRQRRGRETATLLRAEWAADYYPSPEWPVHWLATGRASTGSSPPLPLPFMFQASSPINPSPNGSVHCCHLLVSSLTPLRSAHCLPQLMIVTGSLCIHPIPPHFSCTHLSSCHIDK